MDDRDDGMIERLRYLVLAAQREGNRQLTGALASLEITPSQAEVLQVLAGHGPLSLTGLGELLVCESGTNPSRLVGRLVDAGLVQRSGVAGDARQVRLSLTPQGRERAAAARRVDDELHAHMRARLYLDDLPVVVAALEAVVRDTLAGQALARRDAGARGDRSA